MDTQEGLQQELGIYVAGLLLYSYCMYGCVGAYKLACSYGIRGGSRSGVPYLIGVGIGFLFLSLFYKDRRRELIWKRKQKGSWKLVALCLLFLMGAQFVTMVWAEGVEALVQKAGISLAREREAASGANGTGTMMFYTLVVAPMIEEIVFRGYVLKGLKKYGNSSAIFISALLFGLYHANLIQMVFAFLMGLLLGYVAAEYSVHLTILLHMANNAMVSGMVILGDTKQTMLYGIEGLSFVLVLFLIVWNRRKIFCYIEASGGCNVRSSVRNLWMLLYVGMTVLVAWQGIMGG